MFILMPVPYMPGDKQDANHIRVHHHHATGLTGALVRIYGSDHETVREVRSTSAVEPWQRGEKFAYGKTILVHLKPVPVFKQRIRCLDVSTDDALRIIKQYGRAPTRLEWLSCMWRCGAVFGETDVGERLFQRKLRNMKHKGLIQRAPTLETSDSNQLRLTAKGLRRLEIADARN